MTFSHEQPSCLQCNQHSLEHTWTSLLLCQKCPNSSSSAMVISIRSQPFQTRSFMQQELAVGSVWSHSSVTCTSMVPMVGDGNAAINEDGGETSFVSGGGRECSETVLVHRSSSPACDIPWMEQLQEWDLLVRSCDNLRQNISNFKLCTSGHNWVPAWIVYPGHQESDVLCCQTDLLFSELK